MLKTFTIVAAVAAASIALPASAFAQGGGDTATTHKGPMMGGMKSKSMMMKKGKMSRGMHRGMMKKPMMGGGRM